MSNKNFECKQLQWDTKYFGISSARVELNGIIEECDQNQIINFCNNYDFVTISNQNNIKENNYWLGKSTDSFLADMNIQFIKTLVNETKHQNKDTYITNNYSSNTQIINLSKKSFNYSRFFNDLRLPDKKTKNIYQHWTETAFNQENKYFVISEREGNIAGYILFSFNEVICKIELIAVGEQYQGKNIGKSLIYALESFVIDKGIKKIKVGTQVDNIAAANFYIKMGFTYLSCGSVYHLWKR